MPIYFDKANGSWRYTFNRIIAGRRIRATKLLPKGWSRTQAQAYDDSEGKRILASATGTPTGERKTIEEAVEIYCRERLPALKAGKKQLGEMAQAHWVYAGRYIDELPAVAREYAATEGLKPATIRNRMAYIRAACRYAFKHHDFCAHDPAEKLSLPKPRNERHNYASREQVLQICRKMHNVHARAAVIVAFYSGMRLAEVIRCKVEGDNFVLDNSKNGLPRHIPIHPRLASYARHMPIKAAYRTVQGAYKRACIATGNDTLTYHDLRHSAASAMINAGVDLYTVGGVLGHKSAQSTQRYAHLATQTLAAAVATIGRKCTVGK